MNMRKKWMFLVFLIVVAVVSFFILNDRGSFRIQKELLPAIWQYDSFYTTPEQIATGREKIAVFKDRSGKTAEEKYDLALSIAQEYMKIGDGEGAYVYLLRATRIDPVNSVTYQSMGVLFETLSAYEAAEQAFRQAVVTQPHIAQNHLSLLGFYQRQDRDVEFIDSEFKKALETSDRNINILKEYAGWLEGEKKMSEALSLWREVYTYDKAEAVAKKIAQIKAKIR